MIQILTGIQNTSAALDAERTRLDVISQNIANGAKKITDPIAQVSIFNFHYANPPDAVEQNYALGKVIGENETGFKGTDDDHYRMEAWEFLLAGGGLHPADIDDLGSVRDDRAHPIQRRRLGVRRAPVVEGVRRAVDDRHHQAPVVGERVPAETKRPISRSQSNVAVPWCSVVSSAVGEL